MTHKNKSCLSVAMVVFLPICAAQAQDVDVQGNLTMHDSGETFGNILKGGVPFIHNFGLRNTFIGIGAGNLTMTGDSNTGSGGGALFRNTTGYFNVANGFGSLEFNTTGHHNTANGSFALVENISGFDNTATGLSALAGNISGSDNTANGIVALAQNTTGRFNTAVGAFALGANISGSNNTAIGSNADVLASDLSNATAIGYGAGVDASNKVRVGNSDVSVIEGQVGFTSNSDRERQENLQPVDGEQVLAQIRSLTINSWNFVGQDAGRFRHYGPAAQDFFAAFGNDGLGTIGTPTTLTSSDVDGILTSAVQALERRGMQQAREIASLRAENNDLKNRLAAVEASLGR